MVYPTAVWDGDSGNRDSDDGTQRAPDYRDWDRVIAEVAAVQTRVNNNEDGVDDDAVDSVGTLETVTGLTVSEKGDGAMHKTVISLASVSVASTDGSTAGTDGAWGTKKLYTFPAGHIQIIGAHFTTALGAVAAVTGGGAGFADDADFGLGIGSAAAANSTEWGLSTTEEDIIAEIDYDLTSGASDAAEVGVRDGTQVVFDGSSTPQPVYLNFRTLADGDHGTTADALTITGTLTLTWVNLGDD
jgi:hypothetical protein